MVPAAPLLQFPPSVRDGREQVCDKTDVRDLEDRRFCVRVDRDTDLAALHLCKVLKRARDPDGDTEVRSHDLA